MSMKFIKPFHRSEANLQADFYHQCRTVHLHPYLEYQIPGCRFDCVIVDGEDIIAIIEVKKSREESASVATKRQIEKYNYLSENTPIFILVHPDEIHVIVHKIQTIRKNRHKPRSAEYETRQKMLGY
jgi:hypothetical protein